MEERVRYESEKQDKDCSEEMFESVTNLMIYWNIRAFEETSGSSSEELEIHLNEQIEKSEFDKIKEKISGFLSLNS